MGVLIKASVPKIDRLRRFIRAGRNQTRIIAVSPGERVARRRRFYEPGRDG